MQTDLSSSDLASVKSRYPHAFEGAWVKRFRAPLIVGLAMLYGIYCMWFFAIGKTLDEGNWEIAGAYLADWISYDVRPDIDYRSGEIKVEFPRFSPLGDRPDPAWIETTIGTVEVRSEVNTKPANSSAVSSFMTPSSNSNTAADTGFSFMSPSSSASSTGTSNQAQETGSTAVNSQEGIAKAKVRFGPSTVLTITPEKVAASHGGEDVVLFVDPVAGKVSFEDKLPEWALQKRTDGKVFLNFGFAGRAEVRSKEVKVYRRFFGWENFIFDTNSPFWGQSFGNVMSAAFVGERVDPDRSNISVMWDNFVNNADWQHGDVWLKLLQTIVMAFVGTVFAVLVAFPLSFIAARNITPNRIVNQILKRLFDFLRSVDMLIWALFFTRAFGPGPISGIAAIFFTDTGTFGKLYSEALENIDDKQREGVKSVGATPVAVQRYGVVPQVLPIFLSQALYFWESNTRSATIIGAVGAGGIGLKLWEAIRTNQDWENVAYMVILILIVVFAFDAVSNQLRSRLIGKAAH
ncbi:MAG: phosphonate ABC transporter, permease protein PhnE [Hyphomicrobiales bacterium]